MGRRSRNPGRCFMLAAMSSLCVGGALHAQAGATLSGRVADRSTGKGIAGARIALVGSDRSVASDSSGQFVISALAAGASQFVVRATGFPDFHLVVDLVSGAAAERLIQLDSTASGRLGGAQVLPALSVTAPANAVSYRLVAFERRRQSGRGQYLTEEDIRKSGAYSIADAVKHMRGVMYDCSGSGPCRIQMARAPMRCMPEFIVDDRVMNDFGPLTPIRDIVALELYTGPSEVPGEYAGRNAGCGVVVIWTRSGPTAKRD
jgi:hypothetical protein